MTAQLIKVADGFHLWSDRYDREIADVFAIQDEIANAISTALKLKLSAEPSPLQRRTPNLRAYEAYLKALDQWSKATPESLVLTKELLDRAVAIDPDFAPAHNSLGLYYTMLASIGARPTREVIPQARAAVDAALRIDPSLPEAHALRGVWPSGYDGYDWHEAERHWRVALAREPVASHVRLWYGNHYLAPIGRFQEALDNIATGVEADPLNLLYRYILAANLRNAGRIDQAEGELRRVLDLDENFPLAVSTLGAVRAQQGRLEEALALSEKAYSLTPWSNPVAGQLAALLVRTGAASRAETMLEGLRPGTAWGAPAGLAVFHAMRGEFDRAAEWAERAIESRFPGIIPILRPLMGQSPQWPALARMMNLPEAASQRS